MAKKSKVAGQAEQVEQAEPEDAGRVAFQSLRDIEDGDGPATSPKRSIAHSRFAEQPTSHRPVTVYCEDVNGTPVLWYTAEDGKDEGRTPQMEVDEMTKLDRIVGYDYFIAATRKHLEEIVAQAWAKTRYCIKDGEIRTSVTAVELFSHIDGHKANNISP